MKQGIIGFLLAIVLIVGMSATTLPSLLTVKPATPKSVMVVVSDNPTCTKKSILNGVKNGYVVKLIQIDRLHLTSIIVMEKY